MDGDFIGQKTMLNQIYDGELIYGCFSKNMM